MTVVNIVMVCAAIVRAHKYIFCECNTSQSFANLATYKAGLSHVWFGPWLPSFLLSWLNWPATPSRVEAAVSVPVCRGALLILDLSCVEIWRCSAWAGAERGGMHFYLREWGDARRKVSITYWPPPSFALGIKLKAYSWILLLLNGEDNFQIKDFFLVHS